MAEKMSTVTESVRRLLGGGFPNRFWILGEGLGEHSRFQCVPVPERATLNKETGVRGLACYRTPDHALESKHDQNFAPIAVDLDEARDIAKTLMGAEVRALVLVQEPEAEVHWVV